MLLQFDLQSRTLAFVTEFDACLDRDPRGSIGQPDALALLGELAVHCDVPYTGDLQRQLRVKLALAGDVNRRLRLSRQQVTVVNILGDTTNKSPADYGIILERSD
jgi:hypothetical protein